MLAGTLVTLQCGAGTSSVFFIKHVEKEGTLGWSPGPGCHACLFHATPPPPRPPFLRETGSPWQAVQKMSTSSHGEASADTDETPGRRCGQGAAWGLASLPLGLPFLGLLVTALAPFPGGHPKGCLGPGSRHSRGRPQLELVSGQLGGLSFRQGAQRAGGQWLWDQGSDTECTRLESWP